MAPNATTPMSTASICAVMNATCCDKSGISPYVCMYQFNIVFYYLVVFQYDQGFPSNDHSGVFSVPEPLINRYNIYTFPKIYMTSKVRNRVPMRLCSHGLSIITRLSFHPITLEMCHHLLVFCRIPGHLSS